MLALLVRLTKKKKLAVSVLVSVFLLTDAAVVFAVDVSGVFVVIDECECVPACLLYVGCLKCACRKNE